jgi:hypothetical protein
MYSITSELKQGFSINSSLFKGPGYSPGFFLCVNSFKRLHEEYGQGALPISADVAADVFCLHFYYRRSVVIFAS